MTVSGRTQVAGVIGDPVGHSRSPAMFNAAFAAADLDWVYVALPVPAGLGAAAVAALPVLGIRGWNVTMPHKADAAGACHELSPTAQRLGVVNVCVLRPDGTIFGDSTDGEGFLRALADESVTPRGASVCVLGSGGAARSIVHALGRAGASVTVAARRHGPATAAAALAPDARALEFAALPDHARDFDIVVNATPLGMQGEPPPIPVAALGEQTVVFDTVYAPDPTPFVAEARAQGRRAVNGLGMLIHQAALGFELLTGQTAPLPVMRAAAAESA